MHMGEEWLQIGLYLFFNISNITAVQTKIIAAQTSTNGAQTIATIYISLEPVGGLVTSLPIIKYLI